MNNSRLNTRIIIHSGWLCLIPAIGLVLMLLPVDVQHLLYLHLDLSRQGEYWRFITGHFVYVSWLHWSLNALGIFVLWLFFQNSMSVKVYLPVIFLILSTISIGLLLLSIDLVWYAGFSGILTGLFVFGALTTFTKTPARSAGILVIITVYVLRQLLSGELAEGRLATVHTSSYAHAIGWLAGLVYGLLLVLNTNTK